MYKFEIFVSSILLLLCTCYSNSPSRAFCYRSKLPVLATKILCPSLCFRIFGFDLPGIRGSVYNLFSTSLTTCLYWNLICTRLKFWAFVINVVWQKTRIDRTSMTPQHHRPRRCFTDCSALCRWPKSFLLHVKGRLKTVQPMFHPVLSDIDKKCPTPIRRLGCWFVYFFPQLPRVSS